MFDTSPGIGSFNLFMYFYASSGSLEDLRPFTIILARILAALEFDCLVRAIEAAFTIAEPSYRPGTLCISLNLYNNWIYTQY